MRNRQGELLSFDEDTFDIDVHKKAANARARFHLLSQRTRRRTSFIKVLIVIIAFIAAYFLFDFTSHMISTYEYNRYHRSSVIE